MKKKLFWKIAAFLSFIFLSCASNPRFKGSGDFCGMVVDEKNEPVSEYLINFWRDGILFGSALTNNSGIFVLQNLPSGKYSLDGQKENYSDIRNLKVDFCFRDKFLCCSVFSADGMFDHLRSLIKIEAYDDALKEINLLRCRKDPCVAKVCLCYQAWLYALKKERKMTFIFLKKLRKTKDAEFNKFADKVEVVLNGKNDEEM